MLRKIIKHEFKATAPYYLILYAAFIALTVINKAFWLLNVDNVLIRVIRGVITGAYVVSIIAVVIITMVLIVYRFYKNLLKDEGYLSFTLPVKTSQHINGKLIVSIVWTCLAVVAVIISVLIISLDTTALMQLKDAWNIFEDAYGQFEGVGRLIVSFFVLMVVSLVSGVLMLYASLALGQLFSKHKIIGAVLSYFGFYFITQIIGTLILTVTAVYDSKLMQFTYESQYMTANLAIDLFNNLFLWTIVQQSVLLVIYYVVTHFILNNKLNLE